MSEGESAGRNGKYVVGTFLLFLVISFAGVTFIHQETLRMWWPLVAGALAAIIGWGCRWLLSGRSGG